MTGGDDPIARYESHLPAPLNAPLNVAKLELDQEAEIKLSLIHPNLQSQEQSRSLAEAG